MLFLCLGLLAAQMTGTDTGSSTFTVTEPAQYEAYTTVNYYLNLYDFNKAESLLDKYLEKFPNDPFLLTEKAFILKNLKSDSQKAVLLLKKAIKHYPTYYYSNYLYASILFLDFKAKSSEALINGIGKIKKDKNKNDKDKDDGNKDGKTGEIGEESKDRDILEKALHHLDISIKDNDKYYESQFLMGVILSDREVFEKSNRYLEAAAILKSDPETYFYMAYNYSRLNNTEKELEAYESILEMSPYNGRALSILSQYYLKKGNVNKALSYLERLFLKFPNDTKIYSEYLYSLFAAQKVDKFLEISDTVDISHSSILLFARAFFLSRRQRYDDAIKLLEPVREKDLKTTLLLADLYRRTREYAKAHQTLAGVEEKDRNYIYYSLRIEVLSMMELMGRTAAVFDKIKNSDDILESLTLIDLYNVMFAYAGLHRPNQMLDLARQMKGSLDILDPEHRIAQLIDGLETYIKGGTIRGHHLESQLNIFAFLNLYKKKKNYAEAEALVHRVLKIKENTSGPSFYLELGELYISQRKHKEIKALIRDLSKRFPQRPEILNFHAYYLATENKQLDRALELSSAGREKEPDNPAFLDTYGFILFRLGRFDEAGPYLEKAYEKLPFEKEIIEHLAEYYRHRAEPDKVYRIYRRAIDNDVDYKEELLEKSRLLKKPLPEVVPEDRVAPGPA